MPIYKNASQATSSVPVRRLRLLGALALSVTALLSGCAAFKPEPPEQAVTRRATERWNAMRADQFEKAYGYNTGAYRQLQDWQTWRQKFGPAQAWKSAEVKQVVCESDSKCRAIVEITAQTLLTMKGASTIRTAVDETWLLEQGNWYIVQPL